MQDNDLVLMQRAVELIPLSHDHHWALVLARRCRQSADSVPEMEQAWRQVREAFPIQLEPHFVIEERSLLPALEQIGETTIVARVREDHAALRALAALPDATSDAVRRFGELLEAHVRFEEREVFEVAQRRLTDAALETIAAACRDIPRRAVSCDA